MIRRRAILIIGLALALARAALGAIEPAPQTYVEDRAGVLDTVTRNQLIGVLQELEQKTSARMIVLIVETTGGVPIEQYSIARAEHWKFGANQKGASALIVVAVKDREYRIEVGYNWEGVLPDSFVGTVGRTYFVPNFRAGDFNRGIREGTLAVAQHIAEAKGVKLTGVPTLHSAVQWQTRGRAPPGGGPSGSCCCCGLPILLIVLLLLARRRRGGLFWGLLGGWLLSRSMGRGFGRGGGSFGDSGFGSFGGGGGGGFGGGGASGKW